MKDSIDILNRHKKFIDRICETEIVYTLEDNEGFAISYSNNYEDEDGDQIQLNCFWSDEALAKSCIKEESSEFKIHEIPLTKFIEYWCIGIDHDGFMIGTDFDDNLYGYEADPLELILEIVEQLKALDKKVEFENFEDLNDLESQIKEALYGE